MLVCCNRWSFSPVLLTRIRLLSHGSENSDNAGSHVSVEKLVDFFKRAEESISEAETIAPSPTLSPSLKQRGSNDQPATKAPTAFGGSSQTAAVSYVPWTTSRLLQTMSIRKLIKNRDSSRPSFASLLRHSPFIQMGDFKSRELIGVVIENVNDVDLYIDFGCKFHCVCPQPPDQHYPRGSLVRIRLRSPELTNKFMINSKGISLCEADAVLVGPYRGRIVRPVSAQAASGQRAGVRPSKAGPTDNESVSSDCWQLS